MMRSTRWPAFLALVSFVLAPSATAGQEAPRSGEPLVVHPEATAAIGGIKSPYCPGQMLQTCPSPGAAVIRDSIQQLAEAGLSADSIIELVLSDYGQQWRAAPEPSGTGLWAWLLPPAGLVGGLFAVGMVLARRRREGEIAEAMDDPSPDEEARIREALRKMDEAEEPAF